MKRSSPIPREDEETHSQATQISSARKVGLILLAWMGGVGFDFFYHGGLLAGIYAEENPAFLAPMQAFQRIPIGYSSLLVLVVIVYWLSSLLSIKEWRKGLRFGLEFGALLGITSVLGQYSILNLGLGILALWAAGQTIQLSIIGAIVGAGTSGTPMKKLLTRILIFIVIMLVLTIVMQSTSNNVHAIPSL